MMVEEEFTVTKAAMLGELSAIKEFFDRSTRVLEEGDSQFTLAPGMGGMPRLAVLSARNDHRAPPGRPHRRLAAAGKNSPPLPYGDM